MRLDHSLTLGVCLGLLVITSLGTAAADEPEEQPSNVLGQMYGHREDLLTDDNGLDLICRPITKLAGDGRDVPGFEKGVEEFVAKLTNLQ